MNPNANHNRIWFDSNGLNWDPNGNPEVVTIEGAERADTGGPVDYFFDMHVDWNDSMMYGPPSLFSSPFYLALKQRDPDYTATYYVLNDPDTGYAQSWAQRPISQGGLSASYISTVEFGEQYNDSIDAQHQRGVNIGLAFYDCLLNPNHAPVVDAGGDQSITQPTVTVNLAGAVSDDGLPQGSAVTVTWSKNSGPGTVTFGNANAASTTATFSAVGTYVLRLTASDTEFTPYAQCTITVSLAPGTEVALWRHALAGSRHDPGGEL